MTAESDDTVEVEMWRSDSYPHRWGWRELPKNGWRPQDPNNIYVISRRQYERWVTQRQKLEKLQGEIQRELAKVGKVNPNMPGFLHTREEIESIRCRECGAQPGQPCVTRWSGNKAKEPHFYRKADRDDMDKPKPLTPYRRKQARQPALPGLFYFMPCVALSLPVAGFHTLPRASDAWQLCGALSAMRANCSDAVIRTCGQACAGSSAARPRNQA